MLATGKLLIQKKYFSNAALDGFSSTVARNGTERNGSGKRTVTVLNTKTGTGKQTGTGSAEKTGGNDRELTGFLPFLDLQNSS